MTLYELTDEYERLLEFAKEEDVDEEVFKDTLEALQGDIEVKVDGYCGVIRELETYKDGVEAELQRVIDRLKSQMNSIDHRIQMMKDSLQDSFTVLDIRKMKTPLFTVYIQKNTPSVIIDDPENIPDEYFKVKKELSKTTIKEAIEAGEDIPFAHLEQSESIRIR